MSHIIDKKRQLELKAFEHILHYRFKHRELLNIALTHKSYAFEHPKNVFEWNERLEFFGDSVLGLAVGEYFYRKFKHLQEGELSKLKSHIVCTEMLKHHALRLHVGDYLLLGKGEERMGGRIQTSNLSGALESIIGAIYLDRDLNAAKKIILKIFEADLTHVGKDGSFNKDYKSMLQEHGLKRFGHIPFYEIISQEGPEHKKEFVVGVKINNEVCGRGWGLNKKSAEQMAAKEALEKLHA
jgi:ribonuclease III